MDFEHDGRVYKLHKDPTLAAVEAVTVFDNLLKLAYIDVSILTEDDLKRPVDEILDQQLKTKPLLLAQHDSKVALSEPIRTVILCTGLSEMELQDAPLHVLFEKCCEVMGGTASDFFLKFMKSLISKRMPMTRG